MDEVITKWDESYELRLGDCTNKLFKNINDITKKWSILTSNFGYVLVIIYTTYVYTTCVFICMCAGKFKII